MPEVQREDGARIHWEQRGDGPLVVVAGTYNSPPSALDGLVDDLAEDHRVVRYDPRGNGRSTSVGPYEIATDAEDMGAVVEAAGGGPAVVVGLGDGAHRGIRLSVAHPEVVSDVVSSGTLVLGQAATEDRGGLASSRSVLRTLTTMSKVDYRAAVRSMVETGNPNLSESEIHERVDAMIDYAPADVANARMRSWIGDDLSEVARLLGDRLWVLYYEGNPWFPAALAEAMRELLPEAHFESVEDGAMTRPDQAAAVVRRITRRRPAPSPARPSPAAP
jgi:pimeloyl-ACP methyl ester carboxylesterase